MAPLAGSVDDVEQLLLEHLVYERRQFERGKQGKGLAMGDLELANSVLAK